MEQENVHDEMFVMSPWDFDQSPDGWRQLAERELFLEAADCIEKYLVTNKQALIEEKQRPVHTSREILEFHRGQMLAFSGTMHWPAAVDAFRRAIYPEGKKLWNAYVRATIGYLQHDREAVEQARTIVETSDNADTRSGNLPIIHQLLATLDVGVDDYHLAYTGHHRDEHKKTLE